MSPQEALQGSEKVTRELLGGTIEKSVSRKGAELYKVKEVQFKFN